MAILRPEDFQRQMLQVGDLNMHAVVAGEDGAPLIVLLHGFPEFWYSWRHQIPALAAAGYRVVAVDQRGYNLTDKHGPYDIFTLTDDVANLIHALGYGHAAAVMGHDWGGAITWLFGARYPELVDKLVACNIPHPAVSGAVMQTFYLPQILKSWYIAFFQIPNLPELLISINGYDALADQLKRMAKSAFSDEELGYFKATWSQPGAMSAGIDWYRAFFGNSLPLLSGPIVNIPSLLIWGDQDPFLTTQTAEWTRRYVDHLTIRYIRGASHWVQQECPDMVNRYTLDFLKGL